ncbi:hypothetical protein [Pacificispira sp.]|uniref:hypothetical protein n=1 Tax=Pacificispira sp. TaxID=2888761 RepID=UPI003BAA6DC0
MDSLITAAAGALSAGDPLAALKRVALRDDPPALALRGIAMAQLGDLARARDLLRRAARAFGSNEPIAQARCVLAEAEIALVSRDLGRSLDRLSKARVVLDNAGDPVNAAHAGYLEARRLLLIGRIDEAEQVLESVDPSVLPPASTIGFELVASGLAMRRVRTEPAYAALARAEDAARHLKIPALLAEVEQARRALDSPPARLVTGQNGRLIGLQEVEALLASRTLVVDTFRNMLRAGSITIPLSSRPVLLSLLRALAEAWPKDVPRETLLRRAFQARHADESHRARLRVEIARLREAIAPLALLNATGRGYALHPIRPEEVVVLAPPVESDHAEVLALLADGEAWSSSALAQALGVSARTVQRSLRELVEADKIEAFGRGRACRWVAKSVPGFPTSLLLPAAGLSG